MEYWKTHGFSANPQAQLERICEGGGLTLMVVEHDMHFIGALCEEKK